jgi:microcin C transport system permease protein
MSAPTDSVSLAPWARAWLRFKRNRLGYWSLVIFCLLVGLSLMAELISNDRPLLLRYQGETYFPMVRDYSEKTFGGDFDSPTDYMDPFNRERLSQNGNWALFALNPYGPKTRNYFAKAPNPSPPTADNWLGTDDRGRDLLAQLIYGFRVSVLFALALTFTGTLLGILTGAIQGFFGGKTDLAFQRFIEIWGAMPELYLLIIFSAVFAPSLALAARRSRLKAETVLPEPDSPTSATRSPGTMEKSMPCTTSWPANATDRPRTSSNGVSLMPRPPCAGRAHRAVRHP